MATLTTAEKAKIQAAIDYMVRGQSYEKPLDQEIVQILLPMAAKFGFTGHNGHDTGLADALRDAPFSTLLKALLAVAA